MSQIDEIRRRIGQINEKFAELQANPTSDSALAGLVGFINRVIDIYSKLTEDQKREIYPLINTNIPRIVYSNERIANSVRNFDTLQAPNPAAAQLAAAQLAEGGHAVQAVQQNTFTSEEPYSREVRYINSQKINIDRLVNVLKKKENKSRAASVVAASLSHLIDLINKYIQDFNGLSDFNQAQIHSFNDELITFLRENIPEIIPRIPLILLPPHELPVPQLTTRGFGTVEKISFFSADEKYTIIEPETTLQLSNPERFRVGKSSSINIHILGNGKHVMQQITEIACFITTTAMLFMDNGYDIEDPDLARLLSKKLTGSSHSPENHGATTEEISKYIDLFKLKVPGKYFLHNFFHSIDFDYDVKYFRDLIARYGPLILSVNFRPRLSGSKHAIILDSIDENNAEIREPFHGLAFRMQTRILINRKLGKHDNKYKYSFLSNYAHTHALTSQEDELRVEEAIRKSMKKKYLKYKAKYLQLKKKL